MSLSLRRLKQHYVLVLIVLIVVILLGGYGAGYRPGPGLTIVRVGNLLVTGVPPGTGVYADQVSRGIVSSGTLEAALVPGSHTIIIDAPNQEPFEKIVSITSNETTTLVPILVPKKPVPVPLAGTEAQAAASATFAATLPTETAPLALDCVLISVSDNRIIANAATSTPGCETPPAYLCTEGACSPTIVYSPVTTLHSVIPFPGRTDALIVATGEWVYAIGIDPRAPQFFAPVSHGVSPTVATSSDSAFYLSDNGHDYLVTF